MSKYTEFFLKCRSSVIQLELLEISHPNFSQVYRLVRNSVQPITVTLEDSTIQTFIHCPLKITMTNEQDNLDQIIKIQLGDLGEIIPFELNRVEESNGFSIKPTIKYRTFRSDDLTQPLYGPLILEIKSFSFNNEGSLFEAKAPSLNISKTGEIYSIDRFPMLRGLL